ncbi:TetR/AcrR family transcriptional regulator [Streptomyces sp. SID3343]|uniref:TetR/AcrR family transcriptional regulator n=1 Tax=Streptomyces sp. SID3343 TaxID=2690260 RepID=UPI00136D158A|nr:TetR/AcrR family transcriptional regulator [Streptomyces sp. SID3343]MYV98317.1 TetR family transcriptional regulator [Streptomyces sp. SID3343]
MTPRRPYHHGDLRRAVLSVALDVVTQEGVNAISLRDLARRAGVSHAAPAHHFGDKTGLLTAIAAEGYGLLADALAEIEPGGLDALRELGVRYVLFALAHPGHFEVMNRAQVVDETDAELIDQKQRAGASLRAGVLGVPDDRRGDGDQAVLAAWSLAHGYASLYLSGSVRTDVDPAATFRGLAGTLFAGPAQPQT